MALKYYTNSETGEEKRSLKPLEAPWIEKLVAPQAKFLEKINEDRGISRQKGLTAILKERARNHSRDVDLDKTIHISRINGMDSFAKKNFLNKNGTKRRKIDDI